MADYVKLHTDVLDNRKIQTLPSHFVLPWLNLLLLCRINGGVLPEITDIAFRLRTDQVTVATWILAFRKLHLIDEVGERGELVMHDWEYWNPPMPADRTNAERQKRFREKKKDNTRESNVMNEGVTPLRNESLRPLRNGVTIYPLTTTTIRGEFPNTDDALIGRIVEEAVRSHVDNGGLGEITDAQISEAVRIARWPNGKQQSAGPYVKGVAQVIASELQQIHMRENGNLRSK